MGFRTRPRTTQWERFGQLDPYFGVISADQYRTGNLDPERLRAFFRTGDVHCRSLVDMLRAHVEPDLALGTVVDHGCGVGRLVVPFARMAERVHGIDVSPSMLREAQKNVTAAGLQNVQLHLPSDLDQLRGRVDLVHSFIVFQHMPVAAGERALGELLGLLKPGGLAAIHVPVALSSIKAKLYFDVLPKVPFGPRLWNVAKGRPWSYPIMEMNTYDLLRLVELARGRDAFCRHIEPVDSRAHRRPTVASVVHHGLPAGAILERSPSLSGRLALGHLTLTLHPPHAGPIRTIHP